MDMIKHQKISFTSSVLQPLVKKTHRKKVPITVKKIEKSVKETIQCVPEKKTIFISAYRNAVKSKWGKQAPM
jgi:hypothetical protein